ncbi:MAG: phosphohydrolase [Treponema sp.]|jgi:metal-dependent HD superfamily phosphatase/phosphodiesterase|nr:phosphohydrolase [Treponema sp.]
MRSAKELALDKKIIEALEAHSPVGKALEAARLIMADEEIQVIQEYANNVSIVRLGYNDHGPVHMHCVALNVIKMLGLLKQAGIKTSLEKEGVGNFEDSLIATIFAAMLHDLGMSIGRQDHELHSAYLAAPILDRLLSKLFPDELGFLESLQKKVMIRSLALESISGHMGNRSIYSLEAGVVQVADGCDMTKGRARIPIALHSPRMGSIHQYSANSIEEVRLSQGEEKPIHIEVIMSSEVGLFQVEEVLMTKIASSTAKQHIELYAHVQGGEPKRYL